MLVQFDSRVNEGFSRYFKNGGGGTTCHRAANPLTWIEWEDDEIACSANGHGFSVLAHPKVISMLEHLNTGAPSIVKNLMEDYAGNVDVNGVDFETSAETIRELLEKLHSLRALEIVQTGSDRECVKTQKAFG